MLSRIYYGLCATWRYRKQLRQFVVNPQLQLPSVMDLNIAALATMGIKALILDYDAVLAAHAEPAPRPEIVEWLQKLSKEFAGKIFILSNKPTPVRQHYFQQYFPKIEFVVAPRKKPYPDGIEHILSVANCAPNQAMIIDDRLCTGILVGIITGIQARWITHPYIHFQRRPIREGWFICVRWVEKTLLKAAV